MVWNARPISLSGVDGGDRLALVAAGAELGDQRELGEQRHLQFLGQLGAATGAEQLVALAVVAGEPGHVLDHAADRQVDLLGHRRGEAGHLLRRRLRRGDDEHLAPRQVLAERDGDVAGAGRHVDEQEVGLVPEDVGEELLERLVQHRPPPDDGLALRHEVPDRDAPHAPRLRRQEHLVDHHRIPVGAEHARDRVAVDVGVDDADRVAVGGERDGEVGGDAGLADPALAGRDQQRSGARAGLGERDRPPLGVAVGVGRTGGGGGVAVEPAAQVLPLVVGHDREVDGHAGDVGEGEHGGVDPVGDLVAQRASGDGEGDEDLDRAVVGHLDVAHHAQIDDRAVQLGILHRTQGVDDLVTRDWHRAPSADNGPGHAGRREFALWP